MKKEEKSEEIKVQTSEKSTDFVKKSWKKGAILLIVLFAILGIGACYQLFSKNIDKIIDQDKSTSLYKQLELLIRDDKTPLKGEEKDRINVLLLGIGGENHAGGTLTDTIMVASIKPSTKQVALISLPRDLVVKIYTDKKSRYWEGKKINYAYELGGIDLSVDKVEEVTGLKMHYYVLIDFGGFVKLIDDVGGVSVEVPNTFKGYYHITDCGGTCKNTDGGPYYMEDGDGPYCAFKFQKGEQKMNGETALRFARIRKVAYTDPRAEYEEGSDFARSKRQQKIMEAFKKRALATSTLANPVKITNLMNDLGDHLRTNLELWEMAKLAMMIKDTDNSQITNTTIDDSVEGPLYGVIASDTGAYVLIPKAGDYDFSEIKKITKNVFSAKMLEKKKEEAITEVVEQAAVVILNGTQVVGLANKTSKELSTLNLYITQIGNAPMPAETTAIYDLTEKNPKTLEELKTKLNAQTASDNFTAMYPNANINIEGVDFIVILGQDKAI